MSNPYWTVTDGRLTTPLHVLNFRNGHIAVPNKTTGLWLEIGTNSFDTLEGGLEKRPGLFLVSFEPLVDKWAFMIAKGTRSRVAGPLGRHHARGVILPFAVSDADGYADFHVSPRDGCSSLKPQHMPTRGGWKTSGFIRGACAKTYEVRRVPTVALRTVLGSWLPPEIPIRLLKIDAQGVDLDLLRDAGAAQLARVDEVSMETLNDGCDGIYDGQSNCSTVVATMRGLGFVTRSSCNSSRSFGQGSGCEGNFVFRNIRCGATCGRDPTVASDGGRGARKRAGKTRI